MKHIVYNIIRCASTLPLISQATLSPIQQATLPNMYSNNNNNNHNHNNNNNKMQITCNNAISIPHPFDMTNYVLFLTEQLKNTNYIENRQFYDFLFKSWENLFNHFKQSPDQFILIDAFNTETIKDNIFNFKDGLLKNTFNLIFDIKPLFNIALKIVTHLREKEGLMGPLEYQNLAFILRCYGHVLIKRSSNNTLEKDKPFQLRNLFDEMQTRSVKPTKECYMYFLETLYDPHAEEIRGNIAKLIIQACCRDHPEMMSNPRLIVMSNMVNTLLNIKDTLKYMIKKNCEVNEESISQLLMGILWGNNLHIDKYNNLVASYSNMSIAITLACNELLPYLTSKHIEILFKGTKQNSGMKYGLLLYESLKSKGLYPQEKAFDYFMKLVCKESNNIDYCLQIWSDVVELYQGVPPPWAYSAILRYLPYCKSPRGFYLSNDIFQKAIQSEGMDEPNPSLWPWSPDMYASRLVGCSSMANSQTYALAILNELHEYKIPLTHELILKLFAPISKPEMIDSYLPKLIEFFINTRFPTSPTSIRLGLNRALYRCQMWHRFRINSDINQSIKVNILGYEFNLNDFSGEARQSRNNISYMLAKSLINLILSENYNRRIGEYNHLKLEFLKDNELQMAFNILE